jgi:hypothetical protein
MYPRATALLTNMPLCADRSNINPEQFGSTAESVLMSISNRLIQKLLFDHLNMGFISKSTASSKILLNESIREKNTFSVLV